jgi:hypothetical protein
LIRAGAHRASTALSVDALLLGAGPYCTEEPMAEYKLVVMTNPVAGRERAFNDWYSERHLADVLKIPYFVSAQRFQFDHAIAGNAPDHQYLAIYDIDSNDLDGSLKDLAEAGGTMEISDALDMNVTVWIFRAVTPVQRA